MKAGNYAIASRFLKLLLPLNLRDNAKLQAKQKECEEKLKKTPTDTPSACDERGVAKGSLVRFCFVTLKRVPAAALACSFCGATFIASDVAKSGEKCAFCTYDESKLENAA